MSIYSNETESDAAIRQHNTEITDEIRVKILTEQLSEMHNRICNEEFRTKEECNAFLDIMMAIHNFNNIMVEKHTIRKKEYYDNNMSCNYTEV